MTELLTDQFANQSVAIAGLGGLGSHIAEMLVRSGVGKLLLVDFDRVERSNLNRQYYLPAHIGMYKTEALAEQLLQINPSVQLTIRRQRITAENARMLFAGWSLVCEALDGAAEKAMLINALLLDTSKTIVAASGMAGYESANRIQTTHPFARLYLCGDAVSDMADAPMLAPRVQLCAAHQANMVLRLMLKLQEP